MQQTGENRKETSQRNKQWRFNVLSTRSLDRQFKNELCFLSGQPYWIRPEDYVDWVTPRMQSGRRNATTREEAIAGCFVPVGGRMWTYIGWSMASGRAPRLAITHCLLICSQQASAGLCWWCLCFPSPSVILQLCVISLSGRRSSEPKTNILHSHPWSKHVLPCTWLLIHLDGNHCKLYMLKKKIITQQWPLYQATDWRETRSPTCVYQLVVTRHPVSTATCLHYN